MASVTVFSAATESKLLKRNIKSEGAGQSPSRMLIEIVIEPCLYSKYLPKQFNGVFEIEQMLSYETLEEGTSS